MIHAEHHLPMTTTGGDVCYYGLHDVIPIDLDTVLLFKVWGYDDFMASFMTFFDEMYELKTTVAFSASTSTTLFPFSRSNDGHGRGSRTFCLMGTCFTTHLMGMETSIEASDLLGTVASEQARKQANNTQKEMDLAFFFGMVQCTISPNWRSLGVWSQNSRIQLIIHILPKSDCKMRW